MKKNYAKEFSDLVKLEGYKLLSEYKNARTKVKLICPKGHEYKVIPDSFKRGIRCPKCSNRCPEQAKQNFIELTEKEEFYINSEYKDSTTKISMSCPKGHTFLMSPHSFKRGHRCPKCSGKCTNQAEKEFRELAEKEGYTVNGEYKNNITKISMTCPEGHVFLMSPIGFKRNKRCSKCHIEKRKVLFEKEFREITKQEKYKINGEYKGVMIKISMTCPEGHYFLMKPNNFKNGQRCPHCKGSTGQRELQKRLEIRDLGKMVYNDRKVLNGLELDIYFPDLNIAIEYQGDYWHSKPEAIERDKRKKLLCDELGINLIVVWDSKFTNNPDKEEKKIVNEILKLM